MSNKTQLLNHNERLASVIQTLQGKSVPGGGGASGGSGGIGPMCTLNISTDGPSDPLTVYYMDSDMNILSTQKSGMDLIRGFTISVPSYSPISLNTHFPRETLVGDIVKVTANCYYIITSGSITFNI